MRNRDNKQRHGTTPCYTTLQMIHILQNAQPRKETTSWYYALLYKISPHNYKAIMT